MRKSRSHQGFPLYLSLPLCFLQVSQCRYFRLNRQKESHHNLCSIQIPSYISIYISRSWWGMNASCVVCARWHCLCLQIVTINWSLQRDLILISRSTLIFEKIASVYVQLRFCVFSYFNRSRAIPRRECETRSSRWSIIHPQRSNSPPDNLLRERIVPFPRSFRLVTSSTNFSATSFPLRRPSGQNFSIIRDRCITAHLG